MKTITTLRLDKNDTASIKKLSEAFNLVGGPKGAGISERDAKRTGQPFTLEDAEARLFGRLSTNEFTLDEAMEAVQIIMRRAVELAEKKPVFDDPKLNDTFHEGVVANAQKAARMASEFMADLYTDIAAAGA